MSIADDTTAAATVAAVTAAGLTTTETDTTWTTNSYSISCYIIYIYIQLCVRVFISFLCLSVSVSRRVCLSLYSLHTYAGVTHRRGVSIVPVESFKFHTNISIFWNQSVRRHPPVVFAPFAFTAARSIKIETHVNCASVRYTYCKSSEARPRHKIISTG